MLLVSIRTVPSSFCQFDNKGFLREMQPFAFILTLEGVTIIGLTLSLLTVTMLGPEVRWLEAMVCL